MLNEVVGSNEGAGRHEVGGHEGTVVGGLVYELDGAQTALARIVREIEPEVLEPGFASDLVDRFATMERLAAAGKALAARQVVRSGSWRLQGDATPAHWMARKTGCSVGQAVGVLEASRKLSDLPQTDQAVREGKLSEAQAVQIASAASASPSSEAELLAASQLEGIARLKERCAKIKAAALPDEAGRHEAIRRSRYLRHWADHDGAFRLEGRFTPEAGAIVLAAIGPCRDRICDEAQKDGRRESLEAYAADALIEVAEHVRQCPAKPVPSGPSAMVHVRVDHSALVRGTIEPGETCEIPGIGPIPVSTARSLTNDAFLAAIVTDGTDIVSVAHMGRQIPARLRTALMERDQTCVVPECNQRRRLEIDHVIPVEQRGPTALSNLSRLCSWHHYLKTHRGYRLTGPPGSWRWQPPATPASP